MPQAPRRVRPSDWRPLMQLTRDVAFQLAHEGAVEVTQRGLVVADLASVRGPIRLRRPLGHAASEDDPRAE